MPRAFRSQSLRLANLPIRNLQLGSFITGIFCIGLLLLLTGLLHPSFALADGSMPPDNRQERITDSPSPSARQTPPPASGKGGSGKARNPYDMETLKRFDAGSHRPS